MPPGSRTTPSMGRRLHTELFDIKHTPFGYLMATCDDVQLDDQETKEVPDGH
jgi:hypothetical protein